MNQKSKIGFYFHIPFCPHICPYCDFTKTSKFQKKDVDAYFSGLLNQLNYFLDLLNVIPRLRGDDNSRGDAYATVYFGGGTPGLFKSKFYMPILNKLREYYVLEEVTIETNPYTNYEKNFIDYKNGGFDRITLGAQSLCPNTLKTLGRKHTAQDVLKNIEWARQAGFESIQVDLIYGLKKEIRTINVEEEIKLLHKAGATGISAYFLTLEKRTLFANSNLVDEDIGVDEYLKILHEVCQLGWSQLETSNFSKFDSKHNNLYWYGMPYVGIGTGSHGLLPASPEHTFGRRYKIGQEAISLEPGNDILNFQKQSEFEKNFEIIYEPTRTKQDFIQENIFTFLRTPQGIDCHWLIEMTNDQSLVQRLLKHAKFERALANRELYYHDNKLFLNPQEKIRGDYWALELISFIF